MANHLPASTSTAADALLFPSEAAERLRTPEATLAYWRHIGVGPTWAKVGRRVVYRQSDLESWLEAQFAANGSQPGGLTA